MAHSLSYYLITLLRVGHIVLPTLEMPFTFIFCDFEDLNIAECLLPKPKWQNGGNASPILPQAQKWKFPKSKANHAERKTLSEDEKNT